MTLPKLVFVGYGKTLWLSVIFLRLFAAGLVIICAFSACADELRSWDMETWGTVATKGRVFLDKPLNRQQSSHHAELIFESTVHWENSSGNSFTFRPHIRAGRSDANVAAADVREAYFLTFGNAEKFEWEFRLGIDQVFWGTTESTNLVNIVNQTDFAADPFGDERLGQPMVHGTIAGDYGILSLLVLPYHRPRTFPGFEGRFRTHPWISDRSSDILYEHPDGKRHVDFAARYGTSIGFLDFGISIFEGTAREPLLVLNGCTEQQILSSYLQDKTCRFQQIYNQIEQGGLDIQVTLGDFLGKMEVVRRNGFPPTGYYNAFVVGGEYALYNVFESDADLTLFSEWIHDERRENATNTFQNDLFMAARYNLNDVSDTSFTVSVIDDLDYSTRSLNLLFERRLTDSVSIDIESFLFLKPPEQEDQIYFPLRDDAFLGINLVYGF